MCPLVTLDTEHILQDCPLQDILRLTAWPEETPPEGEERKEARKTWNELRWLAARTGLDGETLSMPYAPPGEKRIQLIK